MSKPNSKRDKHDAFDDVEELIFGARSMQDFLVARLRLNQLFESWERCYDERRHELLVEQVSAALIGIVDEFATIQPPIGSEDDAE